MHRINMSIFYSMGKQDDGNDFNEAIRNSCKLRSRTDTVGKQNGIPVPVQRRFIADSAEKLHKKKMISDS